LASGVDTFSKHTLDQTMKQLRQSDVTIFCIGLGRAFQNYADMNGGMGSMARMNYLQAENQLKTFSQETGGYSWFPQFAGEMPDVSLLQVANSYFRFSNFYFHFSSLAQNPRS